MPKPASMLMKMQIQLIKPLVTSMDISKSREAQDKLGALGANALKKRVTFKNAKLPNAEANFVIPDEIRGDGAILYLHGGGYTAGNLEYACGFGGVMAATLRLPTLCVAYRLAPEFMFPAALDDALEAYTTLLRTFAPENIAVIGESAGGGLSFALALKLKELDLPMPSCIVGISPWTDLTMTSRSAVEREKEDPCLSADALRRYAKMYAGEDLKNPLVSPLFGDLTGLPPSLIFVGTSEVLYDDSACMAKALEAAGCECEFHEEAGMWHVYPLYGVYESQQAIKRLKSFVLLHISGKLKDSNEQQKE